MYVEDAHDIDSEIQLPVALRYIICDDENQHREAAKVLVLLRWEAPTLVKADVLSHCAHVTPMSPRIGARHLEISCLF